MYINIITKASVPQAITKASQCPGKDAMCLLETLSSHKVSMETLSLHFTLKFVWKHTSKGDIPSDKSI